MVSRVWLRADRHRQAHRVRRAHRAPNSADRMPRQLGVHATVDQPSEVTAIPSLVVENAGRKLS